MYQFRMGNDMRISAQISNSGGNNKVNLQTGEHSHSINISPKPDGRGSSVNGGELLFLALATCYCNDIYREARKRGIEVEGVEVDVTGHFGNEGEPASEISYSAAVSAKAPREMILDLMRHTDSVAEIHNTLRHSSSVVLSHCEAREV